MQVIKVPQNSTEWLEARKGKITGSKLKDILTKRGNTKKIGYYQLIADKLAIVDEPNDAMERGHELEQEAIDAFAKDSGMEIDTDLGMWVSDHNSDIAISPDGAVKVDGIYKIAVEVKCLNSARHIQAIIENKIPNDYIDQAMQYFIVNENLTHLYFVFYDPRLTAKPLHVIEMERDDVQETIDDYLAIEIKTLNEINEWVSKLAF